MGAENPVEFWNGLQDQGVKKCHFAMRSSFIRLHLRPQLTSQRTPLLLVIFHIISVHRIIDTLDHWDPRDAPY